VVVPALVLVDLPLVLPLLRCHRPWHHSECSCLRVCVCVVGKLGG
jgi:hypothetical protein